MFEDELEGRQYFPLDFQDGDRSLLMRHPETGISIQIGKISPDFKTIEYFGSPEEINKRIEQFTKHLTDIYLVTAEKEAIKLFKYQEGYILIPKLNIMCRDLFVDIKEEKTHIGYIFKDGSVLLKGKKTEKYVRQLVKNARVFHSQYLN